MTVLEIAPKPDQPSTDDIQKLLEKRRGFFHSVGFAMDGLLRTLVTQRNMKIHWISGLAVMLVGMALPLDIASRASVMFCVFVVLCMEVLNTGLEAFIDLHVRQYARTAMIAKDAAAAAVLVLAFASVVVFADILFHRWRMVVSSGDAIIRTLTFGLPLLGIMAAILWTKRSAPLLVALLLCALGCLVNLAWHSRDEVFSSAALLFVITGALSRFREPRLLADRVLPG
jgi:diacylglycerol kinase